MQVPITFIIKFVGEDIRVGVRQILVLVIVRVSLQEMNVSLCYVPRIAGNMSLCCSICVCLLDASSNCKQVQHNEPATLQVHCCSFGQSSFLAIKLDVCVFFTNSQYQNT